MGLLTACSGSQDDQENIINLNSLTEGKWQLALDLSDENTLPVDFVLSRKDSTYELEFVNAEEQFLVSDVVISEKKITIKDPVFNSWFEGEIINADTIRGFWFKGDTTYKIPFEATSGIKKRFPEPSDLGENQMNIDGIWEVDFSKENPEEHYKSIGKFKQEGDRLFGTFMTETGDYRFLEGNLYNNEFLMSCFDGSHAFLFKAVLGDDDTLRGRFWSGTHWEEPWVAFRNPEVKLSDPEELTFLKEGYDKVDFSLPGIDDKKVSLSDEKYQGKVVIVNIMGPWCPNCKDETIYLSELYDKKNSEGLEIVALSYDVTDDVEVAKNNIRKVKSHFKANYDFLLAGKADKKEAVKTLPMLNHIMSYPTSIFIDRNGTVRKIRTGFYGPGTGEYHTRYIEQTNDFIDKLLSEK